MRLPVTVRMDCMTWAKIWGAQQQRFTQRVIGLERFCVPSDPTSRKQIILCEVSVWTFACRAQRPDIVGRMNKTRGQGGDNSHTQNN